MPSSISAMPKKRWPKRMVVDEVYETKMIHPQYLEPRIAAAQMEPNGRLTVWANAQAPSRAPGNGEDARASSTTCA